MSQSRFSVAGPRLSRIRRARRSARRFVSIHDPEEAAVERALQYAFAPLHRWAFGAAIGAAAAVVTMAVLTIALLRDPEHGVGVGLLVNFFPGFSVSWPGVAVASTWSAFVGFVAGWFVAFCRNLVFATWLLYIRARSAFSQSRDFLDHI